MERTVLVVEDSPTQAERLRLLLEGAGYRVDLARDGREGLDRVRLAPPDLIISDIVMPRMDGYALCQAVKAADRTQGIPVVLLTERHTPLDILQGLERGADNFITKPFEDEYLLERVRRIFEHLELRRHGRLRMDVTLRLGERQVVLNADKQQMVELLLSTFDELCRLNERLVESQRVIEEHTRGLEATVEERTRQLREAEAQYRGLFENAINGIFQTSPGGRILRANPALARILGYDSPEELVTAVTDIAHQVYADPDRRAELTRLLATRGAVTGFEVQARRKDGGVIWVSTNAQAVREPSGAVHYDGTLEDITARKHAEAVAEALGAVGRELAQTLDLGQVTQRIAATVLQLFRGHRAVLYRLDPASGALACVATAGGADPTKWLGQILPPGMGVAGRAVADARPIWSTDLLTDARLVLPAWLAERAREEGYRSVLAVPLSARGEVLGALLVGREGARVFTDDEVRLLSAFADQAALALENARLFGERERRREEAERLAEMGRFLSQSLDSEDVMRRIAESARTLIRTEASTLYRMEPSSGALTPLATSGATALPGLPPGTGAAGLAASTRSPVTTSDLLQDARITLTPELRARLAALPSRAVLAVPLAVQDRVIGGLSLRDRTGRVFTTDEIRLAQAFADQAALALENARLFAEAERRRREAEELGRVARTLTESLDVAAVAERIVESVRSLFAAPSAGFRLLQPDGSLVAIAADRSGAHAAAGDVLAPGKGISGPVVAGGRPMWCRDLLSDPRFVVDDSIRERLAATGLTAFLAVPFRVKGTIIGALSIADRTGREFSEAEAGLLQTFADQAALALQNARQFAETQQAYEELSRTQEQLVHAQKLDAIGRLAGGVAHDFNNLLTVILGRSAMLLGRYESDDALRRHVTLIQNTAERAHALTRQLLAFSRKQVLQPRVLDLNAVVTGMENMLRRLIGEDIELVAALAADLGRVEADPAQLEQVILNLAVNARDAMPEGGRLTIETRNVELDEAYAREHPGARPGPHAMLGVSDTGVGMDAETQARLFEPFFTTKSPGKGTGLGLATVYGIVKQTGGNIFVYSEPGRGATFKVYLPRVEAPVELPEPTPPVPELPRGAETILLVEDEESLRDLAREILEAQGYTVLEAAHPGEALLISERHERPIHLMVTDVVMPEMSGRVLADRIAAGRPEIRVLFMSGYAEDAIVHHGVLAPGTAFVEKPFTPEALARRVREVLDG